ncbi:MAG TPA: hypothetical protein VFA78_09450 [Chloroflexota bacterium]|nr:hypothetical protein [Chloroflexota bacterium]
MSPSCRAIPPAPDFGDCRGPFDTDTESEIGGASAAEKERGGGVAGEVFLRGCGVRRWHGKWLDGDLPLAAEVESLAAGHKHGEPGTRREEVGQDGGGGEEMLDVVQEQKGATLAQHVLDDLAQRQTACFPQAEGGRDGRHDMAGVPHRRQRHYADSAGVRRGGETRRAEGKAGFSDTAGAGERQWTCIAALQEVDDGRFLAFAPKDRCRVEGETVRS